ncbi:MAG: hypothetical protein JSV56_06635 [Methanomassiliicoccales archaeon]|nr:MAG: hypothetical protein JSV56_06635 [Methanomassiliicoccales archaeon]
MKPMEDRVLGSKLGYIEIEELSHLLKQKRGKKEIYQDKNWRESYYFNATDNRKKLSLITTIGILPNRGRCSGFLIFLHKGRIAFSKLFVTSEIRLHETDNFRIRELTYQVEGIDWRLRYRSKKCSMNVLFRPVNEYFSYIKDRKEEKTGNFGRLFSQHIEQAGQFEGEITLNGEKMDFGPSFGHRDHSWGIRDWSGVDSYWLFSCTFGKERAFNLWKGTSRGNKFHTGYIFASERNLKIISSKIKGRFARDKREPTGCEIYFVDEKGGKHKVRCEVICSVPIPMTNCIIYETIAKMEYDNEIGYGLLEHHTRNANPINKVKALVDFQKRKGRRRP